MNTESSDEVRTNFSYAKRKQLSSYWLRVFSLAAVVLVIIAIIMLSVIVFRSDAILKPVDEKITETPELARISDEMLIEVDEYGIYVFSKQVKVNDAVAALPGDRRLLDHRLLLEPNVLADMKSRVYETGQFIFGNGPLTQNILTGAYFNLADAASIRSKRVSFHGTAVVADSTLLTPWCHQPGVLSQMLDERRQAYDEAVAARTNKRGDERVHIVMDFNNEPSEGNEDPMCFSVLGHDSEVHVAEYKPKTYPDVDLSRYVIALPEGEVHILNQKLSVDGHVKYINLAKKNEVPPELLKELVKPRRYDMILGNKNTDQDVCYWTGARLNLANGSPRDICCGCDTKIADLIEDFCAEWQSYLANDATRFVSGSVRIAVKIPRPDSGRNVKPCIYPIVDELALPGKNCHVAYWVQASPSKSCTANK